MNEQSNFIEEGSIDLRDILENYLQYWKWIFLSVIVFGALTVIYVKSKVNLYDNKATIQITEDKASGGLSALQDLSPLSLGKGSSSNIQDEMQVLKSRMLLKKTIDKLNLTTTFYHKSGLKSKELYENNPLGFKLISSLKSLSITDTIIDIKILTDNKITYKIEGNDKGETITLGEKIKIANLEFILVPNIEFLEVFKNKEIILDIKSIEFVVEKYKKLVQIKPVDKQSNILSLSLQHPLPKKAQVVLNTLVQEYQQYSIEDQNRVGKMTDEFVTQRLVSIKAELDEIEKIEESYKTKEEIVSFGFQSEAFVEEKSNNEKRIFEINNRLSVIDFMLENIYNQKDEFKLLPANIGLNELLSQTIEKYNNILLSRNRLLRASSLLNPTVKNLNIELSSLRNNISISLENSKKQSEITLLSLNKKDKKFNSKISSLPKQIREFRAIGRRLGIVSNLYSYLLKKKEENKITMAIALPNSKIVDSAYSSIKPVAPKKMIILLAGLILGFILPIAVIYIRDLLDTKFHSHKDLEKLIDVPVIGDIPVDKSNEKIVVNEGSRSATAESFRLLRTNLDFKLSKVATKSKSIFVTSTISGEGKSFVSLNTACSLALSGKKVILVGMDLRAPKITQYLEVPNRAGVTNYLINPEENSLDKIIFNYRGFPQLDILSSGAVPPNPAELLMSPRVEDLFNELKSKYDYIVVDTAPVNMVTDTLMINQYADMFLYVARANYLDKRLLSFPESLYKEGRLNNMSILINGLDFTKNYYGYGYGYQDDLVKKSWFSKIFKKA